MDGREIELTIKPITKNYLWGTESWVISTHPEGLCVIDSGEYAGQILRDVAGELPVLIKIIETHAPLSIQVHPDDEYARREGHKNGKNEMWYVLEASPGAELILGFNKPVGKEELKQLIQSGEIETAVHRVNVKAGDCYCIPAGLVHAIGGGIKLLEVQQNSNLTYRVYDYKRLDKNGKERELHIDKALDVIDVNLAAQKAEANILAGWDYFKSELITIDEGKAYIKKTPGFEYLTIIRPQVESVFLPPEAGGYTPPPGGGQVTAILTRSHSY